MSIARPATARAPTPTAFCLAAPTTGTGEVDAGLDEPEVGATTGAVPTGVVAGVTGVATVVGAIGDTLTIGIVVVPGVVTG